MSRFSEEHPELAEQIARANEPRVLIALSDAEYIREMAREFQSEHGFSDIPSLNRLSDAIALVRNTATA